MSVSSTAGARVIHTIRARTQQTLTGRMGYPPLTLPLLLTPSDGTQQVEPAV
jgi:hypothetical protein